MLLKVGLKRRTLEIYYFKSVAANMKIQHKKLYTTGKIPDLIRNNYNTIKHNLVWFIDFSSFGHFWVFVILNGATRRVVAFNVKKHNKGKCAFNANDCIFTFNKAFQSSEKPEAIHSDNGGQFKQKKFIQFLENQQIKQSMPNPTYFEFGNQLIERLFRTLKYNFTQIDPMYTNIKNKEQFLTQFQNVIEQYNNNVHSSLHGLSPNNMETAIALYNPEKRHIVSLPAQTHSSEADYIQKIRAEVALKYSGDWITFFLEWQNKQTAEIKETVITQADRVIKEQKLQIEKLQQINELLLSKVESLEQKELQKEILLKQKEEAKLKRASRSRLAPRDMAGFFELQKAIEFVKEQDQYTFYCKARHILCLFLLFSTGIRVSNLLKIQVRHLHQMIESQRFDIEIIKKRNKTVQTFYLPEIVFIFMQNQIMPYIGHVFQNRQDQDFVVTTKDNGEKVLARQTLTQELNKILKHVSKITHKNLSTHSFRINLTTALIEAVGIEAASKAIGHNDIRTTEMYNRRTFNPLESLNAYAKAHTLIQDISVDRRKKHDRYKLNKQLNKKLNKQLNKKLNEK